jgi:hypothetical protein
MEWRTFWYDAHHTVLFMKTAQLMKAAQRMKAEQPMKAEQRRTPHNEENGPIKTANAHQRASARAEPSER